MKKDLHKMPGSGRTCKGLNAMFDPESGGLPAWFPRTVLGILLLACVSVSGAKVPVPYRVIEAGTMGWTMNIDATTPLEVKGTVNDPSGITLIGVNIQVKGTTRGTTTDLDGSFTIEAAAEDSLMFSYIDRKSVV